MKEGRLDGKRKNPPLTSTDVKNVGPKLIQAMEDDNLISSPLAVELLGNIATLRERMKRQEEIERLEEQLSRRRLLIEAVGNAGRTGLKFGLPIILVGGVGKLVYNTWFSEDAQRIVAENEARKKSEDKAKKLEFERTTQYLGLEPTTPSYKGFSVHYPKPAPEIKLTEVARTLMTRETEDLTLPGGLLGIGRSTYIWPREYIRSDGKSVDLLVIGLNYDPDRGSNVWEYKFLRDTTTPEMDTSILVLENKDEINYMALARKGTPWRYELRLLALQRK